MEWAGNENDQTICQHILRWVTVSEKGTIEKKDLATEWTTLEVCLWVQDWNVGELWPAEGITEYEL